MVKYIANPFLHKPEFSKYIDSPITELELMDSLTNKLKVNISEIVNSTGLIEIRLPFSKVKGFDESRLRCKYYNEETK